MHNSRQRPQPPHLSAATGRDATRREPSPPPALGRTPAARTPGAAVLGVYLRELRVQSGLTSTEAARQAHCRPGEVDALEGADPAGTGVHDVLPGLLALYGARHPGHGALDALLSFRNRAEDRGPGWEDRLAALDRGALVRSYSPVTVPAALRTPELAAVTGYGPGRGSDPHRQAWLSARREGRAVPVTFVGTKVLRHDPCVRPEVMARQFDHLAALVANGNAHIRVVQQEEACPDFVAVHEFKAMHQVLYAVEGAALAEYHASGTLTAAAFRSLFETLAEQALTPAGSYGALAGAAARFRRQCRAGAVA
ncbi:Scr1 family TA system antitoxin-like transcriptional regulator [Streptomyces sp. BE147]|uniref:Scr1 family TA system antitoxin-like transcriptional regulator n=1 Tax=Streptomyces sp. BE147 TaxID=3002524 RepID=UPI002E772B2F|nr:Scr1 family TA system antitoxin-like transcriptional regulator [Streptomyces sp. BE147]MEE1741159.1 Scr1 family TA system antitoxin-like transcriptional regulator [Streptomyces sp. BE147]